MATANFNLTKFISESRISGFARTNRFEVMILPPAGLNATSREKISLYCEQTNFPLLNINTKAFKIFGPAYQRPITSEYGGEGISFVFHVDRNMVIRKFFENWMHLVVDPDTFTVGYQSEYITSIFIRQLDENENVTHEVELLEAFPRNMNIMELNNASSNQTHRLNILFAFRYWRSTARTTSPQPVAREVLYPEIPRATIEKTSTKTTTVAKSINRISNVGETIYDELGNSIGTR
jgi:hypothetical protein